MQRKRRKSDDSEEPSTAKEEKASDKRICALPTCFETPMSGPRDQPLPHCEQWDVEDVVSYLEEYGFDKYAPIFKEHEIEGKHLASLNHHDLVSMGITPVGVQKNLLKLFANLCKSKYRDLSKVFNDSIHGHIELHPLLVKIIDTPQFQRLRNIKQLGGCYFVFPGASHNRFEHSIGVCHLAGELVETLRSRQPELDITDKDVLCVKMAGLCHDLGHGPFSHLFDGLFIPKARPGCGWKHENASVDMFDHLVEVNNLQPLLERFDITEGDLTFVKEQIAGPIDTEQCSSQMQAPKWPYLGRSVEKGFLYEIVANKKNGIDVDKWDYFARDCHHLGITISFDYQALVVIIDMVEFVISATNPISKPFISASLSTMDASLFSRFMKFVRVIPVNERLQLCTRDKEVANLYDLFHTRNVLHRRAYQHKTSNVVELMISEALLKADDHIQLLGKDGKPVKLSDCIDDMYAYTNLTDHVFYQILLSNDPELKESRELLHNILKRKLFKCIGQTQPAAWKSKLSRNDSQKIACQIADSWEPPVEEVQKLPVLTADDFLVDVVTFDYGMREENPIDHVRFYLKHDPHRALKVRRDQVSQMLPGKFTEQQVRVYCRKSDEASLRSSWKYFVNWCRGQECVTPKGSHFDLFENEDGDDIDYTPYNTPFGTPAKEEVLSQRDTITPSTKKLLSFDDKD